MTSASRGSGPRAFPRRILVEVFVAAAIGLWIGFMWYAIAGISAVISGDFATYWAGATRVLSGDALYPQWQMEGPFQLGAAAFGRGYVYPPTAALLSAFLGLMSLPISWGFFVLAGAMGLGVVSYRIARQYLSVAPSIVATTLVVFSPPSIESLATGNVNEVIAIGLGLAWLAPHASGYLAVGGALIKLYPAIGLAWAVRYRAPILKPLALAAAIVFLATVVLGPESWQQFARSLANGRSSSLFAPGSPRSLLAPIIGEPAAQILVLAVTALLMVAVVRDHLAERALFVLSVAMILPAPDWYLHYFVVPIVGAMPITLRGLAGHFSRVRRSPAGEPRRGAPALADQVST